MRLKSVTNFAAMLHKVNFKHGTRDGKHDDITSEMKRTGKHFGNISALKTKTIYKIRK